jgi:hypothetical protein
MTVTNADGSTKTFAQSVAMMRWVARKFDATNTSLALNWASTMAQVLLLRNLRSYKRQLLNHATPTISIEGSEPTKEFQYHGKWSAW